MLGLQAHIIVPGFHVGSGAPKGGPHACIAHLLLPSPFLRVLRVPYIYSDGITCSSL